MNTEYSRNRKGGEIKARQRHENLKTALGNLVGHNFPGSRVYVLKDNSDDYKSTPDLCFNIGNYFVPCDVKTGLCSILSFDYSGNGIRILQRNDNMGGMDIDHTCQAMRMLKKFKIASFAANFPIEPRNPLISRKGDIVLFSKKTAKEAIKYCFDYLSCRYPNGNIIDFNPKDTHIVTTLTF